MHENRVRAGNRLSPGKTSRLRLFVPGFDGAGAAARKTGEAILSDDSGLASGLLAFGFAGGAIPADGQRARDRACRIPDQAETQVHI